MKINVKWIEFARSISDLSDHTRIMVGAVIVHKNSIISVGHNQRKTHPKQHRHNHLRFAKCIEAMDSTGSLHAEMHAVIRAERELSDLSKCKLFVYRSDRNGNRAMCRPCAACMDAITKAGIKEIQYTTNDGFAVEYLL